MRFRASPDLSWSYRSARFYTEAHDTTYSDSQELETQTSSLVQVVLISDSSLSSKSKFNLTWSCLGQKSDGNRKSNATCGRTTAADSLNSNLSLSSELRAQNSILLPKLKNEGPHPLNESGVALERFCLLLIGSLTCIGSELYSNRNRQRYWQLCSFNLSRTWMNASPAALSFPCDTYT